MGDEGRQRRSQDTQFKYGTEQEIEADLDEGRDQDEVDRTAGISECS